MAVTTTRSTVDLAGRSSRHRRQGSVRTVLVIAVLGYALVACGDDDNRQAGNLEAYCALVQEIDQSGGPPNDKQMDGLLELAPPEIHDDATFVVEALRGADDPTTLFDDPKFVAALERGDTFKAEHCSTDDPADAPTAPTATIDITITDESFEVSGAVEPGGTIRFESVGDEAHYVQVRKVSDDATVDEALDAIDNQAELDGLAPEVSAPTIVITPGHTVEITDPGLAAGDYLLLDFFPIEGDTEGRFHTDAGLVGHFTVAGDPADEVATTETYTFALGSPITGTAVLAAGHHVLGLERSGDQFGFPTLFRLEDGFGLDAAVTAMNDVFAADVWPVGSGRTLAEHVVVSAYPPLDGDHFNLGVDLDPGTYVLVALGYDSHGFAFAGPEFIALTVT